MRNVWLSSALAVGLVSTLSSVASAGVDGIVTAGEYGHQWTVLGWNGTSVNGATPATLYMTQDASFNLYVALVLPLTYCDNSYGGAGFTSAGWTNAGKNHNLSDLVGSDEATFILKKNTSTTFFTGDMDYVDEVSNGVYASSGFNGSQTAMVGGAQSSMGYNYLNGGMGALFETHSPTLTGNTLGNPIAAGNPNWEYECVYEFKILAGAAGSFGAIDVIGGSGTSSFLQNGFGFELNFVHASPNMFGSNSNGYKITLTSTTPPAVPLPAAAWMGGLMMLGIVAETVRRRRRSALLA